MKDDRVMRANVASRAVRAETAARAGGGGGGGHPRARAAHPRAVPGLAERALVRGAGAALPFLPWLALLGWLSAVAWFFCEDAFISFRYARNLLDGHGLVFNPGEYVEGYTNFLWVLELAAIWKVLGIPPERAAPWLSVACTAGVLGVLGVWCARLPGLCHRRLTSWMAFGLLCSSATFAVWTSGGGMETRQFTFLTVVAAVCLSLWRAERWGLVAASLSLALAAWTRPEGLLTGLVCIGWFAAQSMAEGGCGRPDGRPRPDWRRLAQLAAPFAALVAAHYLFRYAYYGEWLPNTYYAKHVRPWYESGFRYLWAAAVGTGLYLLLPLAALAARERWRAHRDAAFALPLLLIGVHMLYVMRVGGDHFEWRPLDFYWPLLALPAAAGIVHIGSRLAAVRLRLPWLGGMGARGWAAALFAPALFYAGAIQGALLFQGAAIREHISALHVELNDENAGWLLAAPGMPMLAAISNDLRRLIVQQLVASSLAEHREFAKLSLRWWKPYEKMEPGVIPDDALMAAMGLGIQFYHLPRLRAVDIFGLADATVARNPVTRPNHERFIAHDRRPPPGYLAERGVNITVRPAARNPTKALMWGRYAVRVGPGLWMPFDSPDEKWVRARFAGRGLLVREARRASLSWEEAAPDFDYRTGDLGFVVERVIPSRFKLWAFRLQVQAFARNCAPDGLVVWPWSDRKNFATASRWTVNETGLCRAVTLPPPKWINAVADDPSRLKEVRLVGSAAIRSVFNVYLLGRRLIYSRQPCRRDDNDARFFLHVFPVHVRDLPPKRRKHGSDNLNFWMEEPTNPGRHCAAVRTLPDYPIAKIRTGQYLNGVGRLWEETIVLAGSGRRPAP